MKILTVAFEPYGDDTINSSLEAVKALPGEIAGAEIVKAIVPTAFGRSIECLRRAIETYRPDAVVCVGQAARRMAITPERVAINVMDARIPDNDGCLPIDEPIVAGAPAAYFSSLPIKAMVSEIEAEGIPASISNSAGTFVCNQLMYGLMHIIHTEHPNMLGGFIHVPLTPAQAATRKNAPSMAVADMARGLSAAIITVVDSAK